MRQSSAVSLTDASPWHRIIPGSKRRLLSAVIVIALFSFSTFFIGLGTPALWDRDETIYALAAREMQERNEWLVPTIEGKPFLEKPILIYWLARTSYAAFGVDEFSSRLPSAVFGLLTCLTIFFMARPLWGGEAAVFSAIVFSTSLLPAVVFRLFLPDPALTFFSTLALAFYLRSTATAGKAGRFLLLAYSAMALGFLSKGPIALFPAAIFLMHSWLTRKRALPALRYLWLVGLTLVLAAPWFAYALYTQEESMAKFFLFENLHRFASVIEGHRGNAMYYVPVLLLGVFPWSFFLIFALVSEWKSLGERLRHDPAVSLFLLWIVIPFAALSLSATKLPHYLLIVFPALACLAGKFLHEAGSRGRSSLNAPLVATASFTVLIVQLLVVAHFAAPRYAPAAALYPFCLLSVLLLIAVVFALRGRARHAAFLSCAGAALFCAGLFAMSLPWVESLRVMRPIALAAKSAAEHGGEVYRFGVSEPSLSFYSGRYIPSVNEERLDDILRRRVPTYVVVNESKLKKAAPRAAYKIIAKKEGFAESRGPMTLLLIGNGRDEPPQTSP
ncbi:MAG TPA: glycosyltransferase family 39 protein [Candidatus Binatia bacterium]